MTKTVKSVVIAAGVLLILGAVLLLLSLSKPSSDADSGASGGVSQNSQDAQDAQTESAYITDKDAEEVLSLKVTNDSGSYTFTRQKRVVTSTDESGTVTAEDEYYWTTDALKNVAPNESKIRGFVNSLARFVENSVVEEHAQDLEKYGLSEPSATAELSFEDGTSIKMQFGIQNPANSSGIYFRSDDGDKVSLVNYYSMSSALNDVRQFALLILTPTYNSDASNEIQDMKITRADLEEPIELRYMFELDELDEGDDFIISTFNVHRFISPISAEIDVDKGKAITQGIYSLTMNACEYLEQTDENLKKCGLDEPQTTVEFKFGGDKYTLRIGNEIREEQETDDTSISLSSRTGYYAALSGYAGIYSISTANAPWVTVKAADIISRRPVAPYIYSVDSVDVKTPERDYHFLINSDDKTFFCDDKELNGSDFRSFYQTLVSAIGEEFYTGDEKGAFVASVTFNYKEKYRDVFGSESDTLEFFEDNGRKNIIRLNGDTIFKVRSVYTERLIENAAALINGGAVNSEW